VVSPDDFSCVSSWLQTCLTSHKQCGQVSASSLPTRVLDVTAGDNHNLVRLVSGADIQGVYATLSHCWGNLPVQTCSRASISELRRTVPWESLCKTFQDAILVTQGLSINISGSTPYALFKTIMMIANEKSGTWLAFIAMAMLILLQLQV
jgi:hypothetical protein